MGKNPATISITTHLVKQSTGNAKKRLNRTSTNTKQNMKRSANKLKYPNVLPSTLKSVNTRRSNIVKLLTNRNVNMNKSKNVKLSIKPPMKRNKNVTQLTLKNANPATTTKRNARKSLMNLANTSMFQNKC